MRTRVRWDSERILADLTEHPRYRLLVGITVFLAFTLTIGIIQYSFGVFITELEEQMGWSRTQVSIALSFFAIAGAASLPIGWAIDRFGARPIMATSIAVLAVSHLLRPFMTELWHFYALHALQFAAMPGAVVITSARLIGEWFQESRGRAMGFTAMGANFGGVVFSSLTAFLISSIGWQGAYVVYGLLYALFLPMVLIVVRERPATAAAGTSATGAGTITSIGLTLREAIRTRTFYLIAIALLLAQVTYQSVVPQLVPHLENVGIEKATAALALSAMAFFAMGGKVVFGWFCERWPARYALVICVMCKLAGLTILLTAGDRAIVWAFVPVFGFGLGSLGVIMPLLVQDTFGLRAFGTIFGLINFLTLFSALLGPPLVGASFDATGSYQAAFTTICALYVLAAVTIWTARPAVDMRRPSTTAVPAAAAAD